MKRRPGVSLLEVLTAVTLSSIVLSSLGLVLHRTMDYGHATSRSVGLQRTMARLSRIFRDDVHRASQFAIDGSTLTLEHAGQRTVYEWSGHWVTRTRDDADQVHRDEFMFPACCAGRFGSREAGPLAPEQQLVQLAIEIRDPSLRQTDPLPGTTTPRTVIIESVLNRDGMFETAKSTASERVKP